ncbi:unnamed protein product [Ectocarpus sp. CCAP 1310/34]|nr:unnamed protein product [Ectocarpus sp. CCAP 1310/34]
MDGEPPGCQGLDARGGGICPPTWATGPSGWETTQTSNFKSRLPSSTTSPIATQTEMEEPAPAFHAADAEVAQTDRRRRRNSNGGPVGPLIRAWAKHTRRLSDHLAPAVSCKLATCRLHDHMEGP